MDFTHILLKVFADFFLETKESKNWLESFSINNIAIASIHFSSESPHKV